MSAQIRRTEEKIIITLNDVQSRLEAQQICKRVEALLERTIDAKLIFDYTGSLELEPGNFAIWETLLACLKHEQVKAAYFILEKENTAFRFLAQEIARRAAVPCFQRDNLAQLSLN